MLSHIAIGFLETSSIARGIEASDAMAKMADIKLHKTVVIARGKYIIMISGPLGEVRSSMNRGLEILGSTRLHDFTIGDIHKDVLECLDKRRPVKELEALGVIETKEASPAVHAADAAAKAAAITLIEVRAVVPGGKGLVTFTGEPGAVRTAIAAGIKVVPKSMLVGTTFLPLAHPQLVGTVGS